MTVYKNIFTFAALMWVANTVELASAQEVPNASSPADAMRELILENIANDRGKLDAAIRLAPTALKDVESYLAYADQGVRHRALFVLARVPRHGAAAIVRAIRSSDELLVHAALAESEPLMNDATVVDAWVNRFVGSFPGTDARSHAYRMLFRLDEPIRRQVAQKLVPRILGRLREYDARSSLVMALLLGQLGGVHDAETIRALDELRQTADERSLGLWKAPTGWHKDTERDVSRVLEAIQFAEANLGDARAFESYTNDSLGGPVEIRVSRLKLLDKFHPTRHVVNLARTLLEDETELQNVAPSHSPTRLYKRACDFAVSALGTWFDDFAVKTSESRVYSGEELDQAARWLETNRFRLDESNNREHRRSPSRTP